MRKTATSATPATATTTTSAAPREGGTAPDLWERLAAPFAAEEVRSRRGPRGDLRYITARTARRRLNEVLGPANWSCQIEPAERWVRCALTIVLPDGRQLTREALGGYPEMPTDEDRVKGGDSDAFKRACVLFGIGEYLYGDEPAEPAEPRPPSHRPARAAEPPTPTSNGNGRGEPRNAPRDRIGFPDARAFYGWLKDHGHLGLAEEIREREGYPLYIIRWSHEQIDAATLEILQATGGGR
jgi:Rad52/22 family double-strand break repair protein